MDSTSAAAKAWRVGDSCLAPDPKDGTLRAATIQKLTSISHSNDTAWVIFNNKNAEEKEEEEKEEKAVPVSKLTRPGMNHFIQEKPVFPSSVTEPGHCVPLELSDADEDRVPYTINRYLRDYQREGIRFIYNNYIRSRGCILGDDMGLGKTVQVIGFLAAVLHKTGTWEDIENNRPQFLQSQMPSKQSSPSKVFLIVAPLSVLYNWKDELDMWGHFQCVVVHGLRKEEELARIKKGRIEIALTTYETLRLCLDQFNNIDWSAVVVDEAHKIKNPNSQITQAMKELRCKIRIGLTGTILQNNLEELWCVMDWAIPGCLGRLGHFKNQFSDPIEQGQRHNATKRALATGRKTVRALVRKISHWFLRRTKALIGEQLPKKDDRVVYCSLTDFQQTVYQTVLDTDDVTLLLRSSEKCDCQSGRTRRRCCYKTNSEGVPVKHLYFSYLAILRKVANHTALLQSTAGISKKQEKYVGAICAKVFQKFPDFVQRCKTEAFEALSDPMYSGKMKVLQKLFRHYLQKRHKVLVFSLSTKLLDVLESYCMAEGLDFSRLDGSTKSKERLQIVKDFNSSSHVNLCLVSTMAGGLGLNFVGANVVVLFDPTWNPANDLQAIDRAYRIGQCRDVTVLRLISLGTVEEIIYLRQVYKQQLQSSVIGKESARRYFEAVQGRGVHRGELFGIKNLFRLQTQGTCLTRKILEREGRVEAGVMTTSMHRGEEKEEGEEEEVTTGVSKREDASATDGPVPSNDPTKEDRGVTKVPTGVLDFSSGSEEEEEEEEQRLRRNTGADEGSRTGGSSAAPGRMSLLQHGFSRLLERVIEKPDLSEEDSAEGSPLEEYAEDQKGENTSNGAGGLPKLGTTNWDTFRDSDRENEKGARQDKVSLLKENDDAIRRRQSLKRCIDEKMTVNEKSDENSSPNKKKANKLRMHHLEGYSDESEDFDLEAKEDASHSRDRRGDRGGGCLGRNRKRQHASVRNMLRSKYTEYIETFTSSEDECTTARTERSRVGRRAATDTKERHVSRGVSFTSLKGQTSKENNVTIDGVLEGVREVAYTHSNQRVVGGSKAEDLISRAAVRDVFQRKIYSQLPANQVLNTEESLSLSLPDSQPCSATPALRTLSVDHPVTFNSKSVHRTRHTTIIIGETPKAICRQQLEEMAEKFQFPSAREFAKEILRTNSTLRLAWLQQYYTSLNDPNLAAAVTNNFPQTVSAQTSSSVSAASSSLSTKTAAPKCHTNTRTSQKEFPHAAKIPQNTPKNWQCRKRHETPQNIVSLTEKNARIPGNDVREPFKKKKVSQKNAVEPKSDVLNPESGDQEETDCSARGHKRTKRDSVSNSGAFRAGGGLGVHQASSSGLGSGEAAAFLNRTDRDTPSSSDLSHGKSTMVSKPTAQGLERELKSSSPMSEAMQEQSENLQAPSSSSTCSLLTDLIGDTSILDDLLKPKSRSVQRRSALKTTPAGAGSPSLLTGIAFDPDSSSPRQTTQQVKTTELAMKGGRKDFWDILNEGNEESINRLTDPEEIQRVCINTNIAARSRSGQKDTASLWKTNEKFLWRK
ncbi:DNA excision repair protein ERCC-6-like 2 isoform X2 [Mugil cephalus]|uniref:DNA excision repair protein ERCC-6-like 2 isoform X2 n=1 Tax=Mugil cephalus TaxID=48193 RepID=UPI001FB59CAC|nr:DNA excision repair protein ERCC-6-like 2 isoform X2 [Mugil cephalus]